MHASVQKHNTYICSYSSLDCSYLKLNYACMYVYRNTDLPYILTCWL